MVTLPSWAGVIVGLVLLSICGMFLVRKNVKLESLKSHHDVADPMLAVLGTLFAILLGFMLANSMQRFEQARLTVEQEAGAVGDLFRISDGLPAQTKDKIRKDCMAYMNAVIDDEWPLMQKGKMSPQAWNSYGDLWHDCVHYEPQTQGQSDLHQNLVSSMAKVGECRRARFAQLSYGLPPTLWFVVALGGVSTVVFTYFFAVDNIRLQVVMTSVITMVICLNIYMLAGFDAPYSGDIHIPPAAFDTVRSSFQGVLSGGWH